MVARVFVSNCWSESARLMAIQASSGRACGEVPTAVGPASACFDSGCEKYYDFCMDILVEQALGSPCLPEIVNELQARLAEERVRREKFYEEITDQHKMEFINGQVIMHSPNTEKHLSLRENLNGLLQVHVRRWRLGSVRGEKALCVFPRNDYEPDICFFRPEKAARIKPDQLKFPIPGFIAEVLSESTGHRDRGEKFRDYEAHGVLEYWIIDPDDELLEQYFLLGSKYELIQKSGSGDVRSRVIEGFQIPVRAIFDAELNLNVLKELLANASRQ
jgi:Uma2 family endonuclease